MKINEAREKLIHAIRREHYSEKTVESYVGWLNRFFVWCGNEGRRGVVFSDPEERLSGFLSHVSGKVSAATQNQALCALVFFHKHCAGAPIGKLPAWVSAKRPARLPEWVTAAEAVVLFERMRGCARMMGELQFGSGLRLREVVNLRIKDLRFEEGTVVVRGGKGDKDRVTILPVSLIAPLRGFVERSRLFFDDDVRDGVPGVYLPADVGRKCPHHGKRWEWQWVFPSAKRSMDKVSGIIRRHHVHPDILNKALTVACKDARLGRRVTSHALRHGFATELLAAGRPIHEVQELLGHTSIETTEKYLHCLPGLEERTVSPLDVARNVVGIDGRRCA